MAPKKHGILNHPYLSLFLLTLPAFFLLMVTSTAAETFFADGDILSPLDVVTSVLSLLILEFVFTKVWFKGEFDGTLKLEGVVDGLKAYLPVLAIDVVVFVIDRFIYPTATLNDPIDMLCLALFAGITEEMIFRSYTLANFMRVKHDYKSMLAAVVITAVMFGSTHAINLIEGNFWRTITQIFTAMISGGCMAGVYLATGTIIPCMLIHFLHDAINLLFANISASGAMLEGVSVASAIAQTIFSGTELYVAWTLLRPQSFGKIRALWDKKWHLSREANEA